eukprot:SM000004S15026  [mRNA]  locus=s4:837926:838929:+ [translate_table: standard]
MAAKAAEKKRATLTLQELDLLPTDTRTYKPLGAGLLKLEQASKMEECDSVLESAKVGLHQHAAKLGDCQVAQEHLRKSLHDLEASMRELLEQLPTLAAHVMMAPL